jgi:hypothetical protein
MNSLCLACVKISFKAHMRTTKKKTNYNSSLNSKQEETGALHNLAVFEEKLQKLMV